MKTVMIIASAISFIATPALAQDFGSTPSEKIAYGDLDLGSPGGKATLEQRIRAAASRVCRTGSNEQSLADNLAGRVCFKTSVADGLHQMNQLIAARNSGATMAAAVTIVGVR
jgi:UrcA family protein